MRPHSKRSVILLAVSAILLVTTPMGAATLGTPQELELAAGVRAWFMERFGSSLHDDDAMTRAAREHSEVLSTGARLDTH
jgi:hypothetical protein